MRALQIWIVALSLVLAAEQAFGFGKKRDLPTVERVELESYLGLWHEIRRVENDFQDNEPAEGAGPCRKTTAEYGQLSSGKISVTNRCGRKTGVEEARAIARPVPGSQNAKLKVNFTGIPILEKLGIGDGDYWVLALGPLNSKGQYSWSLVGSPGLKYGWVLARDPALSAEELERALSAAEAVGYERSQFKAF
jgi:apolipoprotein D and lipocalin family protein